MPYSASATFRLMCLTEFYASEIVFPAWSM